MRKIPSLYIARTADGIGLPLPSYESRYHVGLKLQAAIASAMRLESGDRIFVPAGFEIGIPDGYCGQVVSYPPIARQHGLIVLDAPQVIHPADRGPLFLLLQNTSSHQVVVHRGDTVGQLVIVPAIQVAWRDVTGQESTKGETTKTEDVLVDSGIQNDSDATEDKMVSAKRVYKSPRNRYSDGGDNEGE